MQNAELLAYTGSELVMSVRADEPEGFQGHWLHQTPGDQLPHHLL